MGYSIIDIKGGTCLFMPSMAAVCAWWNTKFKVSLLSELGSEWFFRELNITGKDIKANGKLRQFQIRDEFGRPVDIRTWTDQTWETNQPAFDWGSFPRFGKRHLPAPEILPGKYAGEDLAIIQARLGAGLVESAHFTPDSFEKAV